MQSAHPLLVRNILYKIRDAQRNLYYSNIDDFTHKIIAIPIAAQAGHKTVLFCGEQKQKRAISKTKFTSAPMFVYTQQKSSAGRDGSRKGVEHLRDAAEVPAQPDDQAVHRQNSGTEMALQASGK